MTGKLVEIPCTEWPAWIHKSYWNRTNNSNQHKYVVQVRRKIALHKLKRFCRPIDTAMFRNLKFSRDTDNNQSNEEMLESINLNYFSYHDSQLQFLKCTTCNHRDYKN